MDSQSRRGALWGSKSEGRHEAGTRRIALTAEWAAHRVVGRFSGFQNLIGACRGRSGTVFLVCSSGRGRGVGEPPRHVAGELRCRGQVLKKIVDLRRRNLTISCVPHSPEGELSAGSTPPRFSDQEEGPYSS